MRNFSGKYSFNPFYNPNQQQQHQSYQVYGGQQQQLNRNQQSQQQNNFAFSFFPQNLDNTYQPQPSDSPYKVFLYKIFPGFKVKSFIFIVSMLLVLCYITELLIHYIKGTEWVCVLIRMQAKYLPKIYYQYEYQRLVAPIFLHAGFIHLFFNLLSQLIFGFILEKYYSLKFFIPIYFISGIAGNLISCITSPDSVSVGASSAIFGIFGLQICYYLSNYQRLGENRKIVIGVFLAYVFLQFISSIQSNQQQTTSELTSQQSESVIDIGSHLGGLVSGFLLGFLLYENPDDIKLQLKKKIAAGGLILLYTVTFLWITFHKPSFISKQSTQQQCRKF